MIVLANGDKWITGEEEYAGNLPIKSSTEVIGKLIGGNTESRKYTEEYGWDINFNPYVEVLVSLAKRKLLTDFLMPTKCLTTKLLWFFVTYMIRKLQRTSFLTLKNSPR